MVWQLTGNTPEPMIKAAEMLIPYGGIGIDLNMGCSAPDIAKTGAGIAWMSKPLPEVAKLVSGVRGAIDTIAAIEKIASIDGAAAANAGGSEHISGEGNSRFRLSVKLRLGEDDNYERLITFCRMLVDEGAELLTLHPRVRRGTYSRPAKREIVARLASDVGVPVYGNGDVSSPEDALDFIARYPCSGLMIGRSAVQKPWIFGGIRKLEKGDRSGFPETIDHLEVARSFLEHLAICQPGEFQLTRAHRFFFYYCDNFSFAHHIKMKIQNAKTIESIIPLLEEYFASVPADQFLLK